MFSQLSTDNLLDNLESELTELVELDSPKSVKNSSLKNFPSKSFENPFPKNVKIPSPIPRKSPSKISPEKTFKPPVPAKRNFLEESPEKQKFPVPPPRKNHSLDKKEKNDENEIIQMTSLHSDHASSDVEHISRGSSTQSRQSTVINVDERKKKIKNVKTFHESEKISREESFFVVKHGKWADEAKNEQEIEEIKDKVEAVAEKTFKPALEVITEKPKKKKNKKLKERKSSVSSVASEPHKSETESSSLGESPQPKKKIKKPEKKVKSHKKKTSEEVTLTSATTQASSKRSALKKDATSSEKAIGIFINNTGAIKYSNILKSPKVKVSFYNEDNGKQIGESFWTKVGTFNNDF
jgi:hypothetical protein